jgi:hypothetical protein
MVSPLGQGYTLLSWCWHPFAVLRGIVGKVKCKFCVPPASGMPARCTAHSTVLIMAQAFVHMAHDVISD